MTPPHPPRSGTPAPPALHGLLVLLLLAAVLLALLPAGVARAEHPQPPRAAAAAEANPLAGHPWGVYRGGTELAWAPYVRARGHEKRLLGKIALRPKAKWFGDWIPDDRVAEKVREYVDATTRGNPDVLVQMTVFRMVPWEGEACRRLPTPAEKRSYRRWITRFAGAVGDTRAAVVVQPDGPFALCAPRGSRVLSRLVAFATRTLAALPRTTVYVEAGSAGWNHLDPENAVRLLLRSGVAHARGFHLNTTHYESTARQVRFGARVVEALARRGVRDVHFTVDTAQNGRPFTWEQHRRLHGGDFDSAPACRTKQQRHCATLGIPPTTAVAARRWRLPRDVRRLAREHVDAYLWAGRPWLHRQATPFDRRRALALARTTPW